MHWNYHFVALNSRVLRFIVVPWLIFFESIRITWRSLCIDTGTKIAFSNKTKIPNRIGKRDKPDFTIKLLDASFRNLQCQQTCGYGSEDLHSLGTLVTQNNITPNIVYDVQVTHFEQCRFSCRRVRANAIFFKKKKNTRTTRNDILLPRSQMYTVCG